MKLFSVTFLLALVLTACPTVRCFGFIETVFDNLQTQSTITRNIATRAEQENAKKRAEELLQKHASLGEHHFILVKTTPEEDVATTVDHKKSAHHTKLVDDSEPAERVEPAEHGPSTYVIYDTQTHTTADKYAYSNINAPKGSTVAIGGVDVCVAE
jgi:hypothetical protein